MQREKIESLLMDHALGATRDDVAALVEAYVEKDAEARQTLKELRGTVGMAKRTLADRAMALPPFPREAMERTARWTIWRRRVLIGGAMAACVATGVWAGWLFGGSQKDRVVLVGVEQTVTHGPVEVAAVRDFWSVKRLRATVQEARSDARDAGVDRQRELALRHFFGGGL